MSMSALADALRRALDAAPVSTARTGECPDCGDDGGTLNEVTGVCLRCEVEAAADRLDRYGH